jgi:predicted secreted protein
MNSPTLVYWAQRALIGLTFLVFISQFIWRSGGAGVVNSIVVFLIVWWLILFMVLPIGLRSQTEAEDIVSGTEPGAPTDPQLKKKAWWSTVATSVVWLIWVVLAETGALTLPDFSY